MIPVVTAVFTAATSIWTNHQNKKNAISERTTDLIKSKDSHNHTWELASLAGEGFELKVIRLIAFIEVTLGTVITVYDPTVGTAIWTALATVPGWVIGLKVTIYGWAFGSTPIKNAAAGLVGGVIKFKK